jgi:F-type H+-transporting ATPase subunit g
MSSASSAAGGTTPESILSSVRNVNGKQLASIGVVFAELLGFFTVGTMIGRMKVVGYHGEVHHEH